MFGELAALWQRRHTSWEPPTHDDLRALAELSTQDEPWHATEPITEKEGKVMANHIPHHALHYAMV